MKTFVPKVKLPAVKDHSNPDSTFWDFFPKNTNLIGKSMINAMRLMSLALAVGVLDTERLNLVYADITKGADIGCNGPCRQRTVCQNTKSCNMFPEHITDAIACWINSGYAAGPFELSEVPSDAKINSILCRQKPNGSVRVILNLSAPEDLSVNDGIDTSLFPTIMSSTAKWLACLNSAGIKCLMTKLDWSDAYKHIHVRPEDISLQYFQWMGKYFVELCLVFGSASSAGIYDRAAKTVLDIAQKLCNFPVQMICQYLDDVCAAAPQGSRDIFKFRETYINVAKELGILLAPDTDPEKSFEPKSHGVILGIYYDTTTWTWSIPCEKLHRFLAQIKNALNTEYLTNAEIWSLVGRVLHYAPLFPGGRFNIIHLIKLNSVSTIKKQLVPLTEKFKRQLYFWYLTLKATTNCASIPNIDLRAPAWSIDFYTDAAGGSTFTPGLGTGGVQSNWWFYVPWSRAINCGTKAHDGKKLSQKMSALELVGPLICVSSHCDKIRSRHITIHVDNSGSVEIWRKGYSNTCDLCTTLVTAIAEVSAGLGCTTHIAKISRRSSTGPILADYLSKAEFPLFRNLAENSGWDIDLNPAWIPPSILLWISNPKVTDDLGTQILTDISKRTPILGFNLL